MKEEIMATLFIFQKWVLHKNNYFFQSSLFSLISQMRSQARYILEPYKGINSRYTCPQCHQKKSFSRYIDVTTGKHLDSSVGRCNHESSCGYHYTPRQYFRDRKSLYPSYMPMHSLPHSIAEDKFQAPDFIPTDAFKGTLSSYGSNNFATYLLSLFGPDITGELIKKYFIGSSDHWRGATIFWQIDIEFKIRSGKIMLYNPVTGKRIKDPYSHITWVHRTMHLKDFHLDQCYFGEHLLATYPDLPIGIVESEKTAIISSVYYPDYVWLAVGSLNNLKIEKLESLKGRNITLFPDLGGLEKWSKKANILQNSANITISPILDQIATDEERKQGLDLADYLIRFSPEDFQIEYK